MQTLVQIAGRAGRSAQYSNNQVTFYGRKYTRAIQQAITTSNYNHYRIKSWIIRPVCYVSSHWFMN